MKIRYPKNIRIVVRYTVGLFVCLVICTSFISETLGTDATLHPKLFDSEKLLKLKLTGDISDLMKDRGNERSYHPEILTVLDDRLEETEHRIKVKVRGNYRRLKSNCKYPPLRLNFDKDEIPKQSIFFGQNKLKLVVPCQQEESVIREYLVYKIFNLITPYSFKVRLVELHFDDVEKKKNYKPHYAFLIEDADVMAKRNNSIVLDRNHLKPKHMQSQAFLRMSVFAYMIGNTDWSTQYQHNVKLIYKESENAVICVPYDFDMTGIVDNNYAKPDPSLELKSIRERRYRGDCMENTEILTPVISHFNALKSDIYKLYKDNPNINDKYASNTIKYLDAFYDTLNEPKKCKKEFTYPCDKYGTGNIVISGMKKN